MKALRYYGAQDIRYESMDDPTPQSDRDAIVKVTACAICGRSKSAAASRVDCLGGYGGLSVRAGPRRCAGISHPAAAGRRTGKPAPTSSCPG